MPISIIVTHEVTDTARWLASEKRAEALGSVGVSNIRTFVGQRDPRQVTLIADVADLDALMAALAGPDPAIAESMHADGVLPETLSIYIESGASAQSESVLEDLAPESAEELADVKGGHYFAF